MGLIVTNRQLQQQLDRIEQKVDLMTEQQDQINTDVQAIEAGVANLATAAAAIQAEIDALKQQNPALDLSGLDKAAADLTGAVSSVQALAPPATES